MIPYVIHVSLNITACILFYKLFLKKETFYLMNRFILIICLALSFALPTYKIPSRYTLKNPTSVISKPRASNIDYNQKLIFKSIPSRQTDNIAPISTALKERNDLHKINYWSYLFYIYWLGVIVFSLHLLIQIGIIIYRISINTIDEKDGFSLIKLKGENCPYSFGKYIFINPDLYDKETFNQILAHEKIHAKQKHTFDILLAELALTLQWFNPFAWSYRKEIEQNLEYLTDDMIVSHVNIEKTSYQLNLLRISNAQSLFNITSYYNQSQIKNRIIMMNKRKSHFSSMGKYIFLAPILGVLCCILNKPKALSKPLANIYKTGPNKIMESKKNSISGTWSATINDKQVSFDFKDENSPRTWSGNPPYKRNEFASLPKNENGEFSLKLDAGIIVFNGKFDENHGQGHFIFNVNKSFNDYLIKQKIVDMDQNDMFLFALLKINKECLEFLTNNGIDHLEKSDLILTRLLNIDREYISFWKKEGYVNITLHQLVSAKALGIDQSYTHNINSTRSKPLKFEDLIALKTLGTTGKDVNHILNDSNLDILDSNNSELTATQTLSKMTLNADSDYINSMTKAGYGTLIKNHLEALKLLNITPEYIRSFQNLGYKNLSFETLFAIRSSDITAEYVNNFIQLGYKNEMLDKFATMKNLMIDAGFIKGLNELGYVNTPLDKVIFLKMNDITPNYIASLKKKGLIAKDLDSYIHLKQSFN
jgi:hypothetical protein